MSLTSAIGVSAIVPTWNEEAWLPSLLARLDAESAVTEVVVADNASTDATAPIALAAGCTLVPGGRPAAGRNTAARATRGGLLLFTDADVVVTPEVVAAALEELRDPTCMLVHFRLVPVTDRRFVKVCYRLVDVHARLCRRIGRPQASAPLIVVRREAFFAVGGFDERIHAAEDVEFISRVGERLGGVAYVRSPSLRVSARRFDLESPLLYGLKCVMWALLRMVGLRLSVRGYVWMPYPDDLLRPDCEV